MKLLLVTRKVDIQDDRTGFFVDWINRLAGKIDHLYVICLEIGDISTLASNITVQSMGKEMGYTRLRKLLRYRKFLKQFLPDVDGVFIHMMPRYVNVGGALIKKHKKKLVFWYTHKSVDRALKKTQRYVDQYVTASKLSFRMETDIPVTVMGHGIPIEMFVADSQVYDARQTFNILTVGRIAESKNIDVLLHAVHTLMVTHSLPVSCRVIGAPATNIDQSYQERLFTLVKKLQLEKYVEFAGGKSHSELPEYFKQADVFVNLSSTGSLDKVVLEAMAAKTIVVTSNEAFTDVLYPLHDTLMCEHKDSMALANKLLWVSKLSTKEQQSLQTQLFDIVSKKHNLDVLIDKIVLLFK